MKQNLKRSLMRAGMCAVWILLGVILFITNRGHTVLVDNKDVESPEFIEASDLITVWIDGRWGVEFFNGDRDRYTVAGSKHRIRVEYSDGTPTFEGTFRLPIKSDTYLLSIPKMTEGIEPFVDVFQAAPESRNREEDDFGSFEGFGSGEPGFDEEPPV